MSISLRDILSRVNTEQPSQSGAAQGAASVSAVAKQMHTAAVLNSLAAGQTISGQIRSMQGSQILLDIGNGVEINARLDDNIQASTGKSMLFEVKSNANDKLVLSPLYTNLAGGKSAAAGALSAAGMPVTGDNLTMVKSMMEEGMPIDRASLWQMGKAVAEFPQASPDTIVRLTAMGMELNETNVAQYEAAQNMQHQLLYTMGNITDGLQQALALFEEDGQIAESLQFMKDMLGIFGGGAEVSEKAAAKELPVSGAAQDTAGGAKAADGAAAGSGEAVGGAAGKEDAAALMKELDNLLQEAVGRKEGSGAQSGEAAGNVLQKTAQDTGTPAEMPKESLLSGRELLPESLTEHLKSLQEEFTKQVKSLMLNEWTIDPERFSDKEEVREFYQKIKSQAGQLQELFSSAGKADTASGQAASNLNQNLDFMQNVNQMFPYLQIPLKASVENAHGELYVYQRKRGKVSQDGSCSALLHLEMQHLGTMDIYVKMKDFHVSTQFTLTDESVLDFLAEHIHILNERLEKKGYHMSAEMKYKEDDKQESVMSRIRGVEENDTVISYTSFDVRA